MHPTLWLEPTLKIATCEFIVNKNSWYLLPEDFAQLLAKRGFIKIIGTEETPEEPDMILISSPINLPQATKIRENPFGADFGDDYT